MKIHHLRNATMLLTINEHRLLVDPMLSKPGALPGFKLFGGGRRSNPLVSLPDTADQALVQATGVIVTHEHPDHLDRAAITWIAAHGLPVWASSVDAANLQRKGLDVHVLRDGALGMAVESVVCRHGRGPAAWMMGPASGFYLAHADEPSIYLTSDTVFCPPVQDAVARLQPDVIVAPAGAANFGIGPDLLFSMEELITLVRQAPGEVVLNHLEALDHCPTTRQDLQQRLIAEGLSSRVHIPQDGEELRFDRRKSARHPQVKAGAEPRPGFQKWLTSKFSGT